MAQPIWLTPAGSLDVIPEGVFYQTTLLADTAPLPISITCTATSSVTNLITCTNTTGIYAGLNVQFSGETFGGIDSNIRYFVYAVVNSTQFSISPTESLATQVSLTTASGTMTPVFTQHVYYFKVAGELPPGIQISDNGLIVGVPRAVASLQGVPVAVNQDITSKFTIRAYTTTSTGITDRIKDRTFTLTITGNDVPEFTTPAGSLGSFYDGDQLAIQIGYTDTDPNETVVVSLIEGQLPGGISISASGLISGYIQPEPNVNEPPGYDLTPEYTLPYDFLVSAISKNYQFTLEVTDGKSYSLRTFYFFVYNRNTITADTTEITADTTSVTADETTERRPFLTNASPADLGTVRGDNYYAYQFIGNDYDTPDLKYAINVNQGSGLPPGLTLDPVSGWYYGYIPDQGVTEVEYSFNVVTYQAAFATQSLVINRTQSGSNYIYTSGTGILNVGDPIQLADPFGGLLAATTYTVQTIVSQDTVTQQVIFTVSGATLTNETGSSVATLIISCSATTFGTNLITCNSTAQLGIGQPIVFTGTGFGGITASPTQVYYVLAINSPTQFSVTDILSSDVAVDLTTSAGTMLANLIVASDPYPFTIIISGAVAAEVTWLTPSDLGSIENGDISLLVIEAVNRGGRELFYRLESGAFNELTQGLELLPSGEISGQVSFNTFAVDLGSTTFDANQTTWDSSFTFTVNAYAADTEQIVYDVSSVTVTNGGLNYSSINPPVLVFSSPVGASAIQAQPGNVTISGGVITSVAVADAGAGYSGPATITITEGFGGSDAVLTPVMRATGIRDVVSVYKTFSIRLIRTYNKPYQNLSVQAMPPTNDRVLVASLLDNPDIFVPDFIFRPDDPYFGKSSRVIYQHAFGLEPDALETYVSSLYENHYWKNLVLGQISTAQAIDPVTGQVVYEVVYSNIIGGLVNAAGESVAKIVNLPYAITDPADGSTQITQVYPNSLANMRNQVIDVVGQISTKLPLWMTSKQTDGRVLGFTPAWVMCYVKPGYSRQIAYYIATEFGNQLNKVDFKVDRYILDRSLSRNWNTATQDWTPEASLTTFDRYGSGIFPFLGYVDIATQLAYTDINNQTLEIIAANGGLDGQINQINGNTIIFVKQEYYDGYPTIDDAWQDYTSPYGGLYSPDTVGTGFDESYPIPGGTGIECTNTAGTSNYVKATNTQGLLVNDPVWFVGTTFGGIVANEANGLTQIYYVTSVVNSACTVTASGTDLITCASTANMATDDQVWFTGTTFGGVNPLTASNTVQLYYVTKISGTQFKISLAQGGAFVSLSTATGSMTVNTRYFTVSTAQGGTNQVLSTASGSMTLNYGNQRMAVFTITVDPVTTLVTLSPTTLSAETQYVQITRGNQFIGQQLYYPTSPAEGYTVVNWIQVPESNVGETTFDQGSMAFEVPVDMYDPTDRYDKYLVFPKANILV
jgi:hypothetical protein